MATRTHASSDPALSAESRSGGRLTGGGTTGNELLTNATGAVLLLLLAVLGVTILRIQQLLEVHLLVGMLLVPPIMLKMASTGYRFTRYYTGSERYTAKGPPLAALRLLAPLVVLTTTVVFASGVVLLFVGPSARNFWFPIHKVSFFAWLAVTAVHVLAHLPEMPRALRADYDRTGMREDVAGRSGRMMALAGALVLGVVLAIIVIPDFPAWLNYVPMFNGDH